MAKEVGGIKTFTVKDLSELLSLTPQSVRKLLKDGKIKAKKIGTRWIITEEAIREFISGEEATEKEESKQ